jgi:tripartite-type tricarboxylate transporter receptor subunit TctC
MGSIPIQNWPKAARAPKIDAPFHFIGAIMKTIKTTRRTAIRGAALLLTGLAAVLPAHAHERWPDRPIKLVGPYTAGGVVDVLGRMVGKHLQDTLKTSVVVENVTGAGGTIGAAAVAKAPADGYTFLLGATGPISVARVLFPSLAYDPERSFQPIALMGVAPFVVVTNKATGWKTIRDVVEASRRDPAAVTYGSAGNGTPQHIIGEMFREATGASLTHVPYRGSMPAIQDLMGGQIKLMFDNPVNLLSHIKAGTLVALGQTGASRMAALSDVPTMVEAGVPGFNATPWYGLMAPRGVPPAVAQKVNQEINAFLQQPAVVDKLADLGMTTRRMSVPEMEAVLQVEGKKWSAAASSTNKN